MARVNPTLSATQSSHTDVPYKTRIFQAKTAGFRTVSHVNLAAETRRGWRPRGIRGPCSGHDGRLSEGLGEFRRAGQRNSRVISREIAQIDVLAPASRVGYRAGGYA